MAQYYYSVQPFLAWCLGHYFYNGEHFTFVGAPFYPYRLGNPRTSSGLRIYEDYYEPWKDEDEYSGFISTKRLGLRKGINKAQSAFQNDLGRICDNIDIGFFYPVVYRVDIEPIQANDPARLQKFGSGLIVPGKCEKSSNEYTITNLREKPRCDDPNGDFDLIFDDMDVEITTQDEQITRLNNLLAAGETLPPRENEKLSIYKILKRLRDEQNTLPDTDVFAILKQYSGI